MLIRRLQLTDFRNFHTLDLAPGASLNIFVGENAQGKTSILEAVWLLATTRSLRATRESELIRAGAELACVTADLERERAGAVNLQVCVLENDRKSVRVNGMKRARTIDLLGEFNAVIFAAMDLAMVAGEPSGRRHFLNVAISQISPRYVLDHAHYRRVLQQRNRLLRDTRERPRPSASGELEAWDAELVKYGARIIERRRFFLERMAPVADSIHQNLTDGAERLSVQYAPGVPLQRAASADSGGETAAPWPEDGSASTESERQIAQAFYAELARLRPEEMRRGGTLLGPQRDDIRLLIDAVDARIYASQGQQRTVALALKLGEHRLTHEYVGEPPVMLLDDVMSDLDDRRRGKLLDWVAGRCQTLLTCTNLRAIPEKVLRSAQVFEVASGVIAAGAA